MNRRNFLKKTSLAGMALTAPITAIAKNKSKEKNSLIASDNANYTSDDFALNEISIDELQQKMNAGIYSSRQLTEMYLKRIYEIDKSGPALNAIIELNPDALQIADKMDSERKSGKTRGPLHGIPVLIKDNIDTGDKMMTTAGSLAMEGNIASKDAFIIQQLRLAGAVLLGKTNLSEWANFRSTRPTSGWSSRGNQTKNPCVLDRNPCGSSSGSAVAVAANLCAVAIGSETDGSITAPSSFCGIVGIKPTVGLLSRSGIIPISKTQDTAGPMARTVKDAAILLTALSGADTNDPATLHGLKKEDYTRMLNNNALYGKKIGVEKSFLQGHEGVTGLYQEAIETIRKLGAEVIEVELVKQTSELGEAEFTLMKYEFKEGLDNYLKKANARVKSLSEVIAFNKQNESRVMPFFKQEILESSNTKESLNNKEYKDALAKTISSKKIIDELMKQYNLDAICATTIGLPNCIDLVNGDYDTGFYFGSPAAMAGYPHISVPMGKVHELPVGLSFIAGAFKEAEILSFAYAFEQATKKREKPKFLKTVSSK